MSGQARYRFGVLGAAALFSTGGAAIKACGLHAWQVASFRSGVAILALLALMPSARRGYSWKSVVVGIAYAATMILFVTANKLTTAANTIFLQSTGPLYILVLAPWLLAEKITRTDVLLMATIAGGLAIFFVDVPGASSFAADPFLGNLCAVASGLSYALTLLGLRWLTRDGGSALSAVVVGNSLAFALALPMALPVVDASLRDVAILAYLGVVQIGVSYSLLTYGLEKVPAFEASLLILLEPALSPVGAWIFQSEVPSGWTIAGGLVILGSSTAKTWIDQRFKRIAPTP